MKFNLDRIQLILRVPRDFTFLTSEHFENDEGSFHSNLPSGENIENFKSLWNSGPVTLVNETNKSINDSVIDIQPKVPGYIPPASKVSINPLVYIKPKKIDFRIDDSSLPAIMSAKTISKNSKIRSGSLKKINPVSDQDLLMKRVKNPEIIELSSFESPESKNIVKSHDSDQIDHVPYALPIDDPEEWERNYTPSDRRERAEYWSKMEELERKYPHISTEDIKNALMMTNGVFEYAKSILDHDGDLERVPQCIMPFCFTPVDDTRLLMGGSLNLKAPSAVKDRYIFLGIKKQ